jgi:cation:H+ antiporter
VKESLLEILTGRGPLIPLLALTLAGGAVVAAAGRLTRHADALARETRLGGLWIGSLLLAAATSLPEMLADLDAALLGMPDIGVGDLFGSTLTNMLILALLDLARRRGVWYSVDPGHARLGTLGIVLTAVAGLAITVGGWGRIGHVGTETLAIAAVYLGAMRGLYRSITDGLAPADRPQAGRLHRARRSAVRGFGLTALVLLAITPLLVLSAEAFSRESGLTEALVGALLVGLTTSLPEVATTVAAIRLGAVDLAVGNILGSNAFNMMILLVMDVAYVRGPVLAAVSRDHLVTSFGAVACIGLGLMAIVARGAHRPRNLRAESVLIIAAYVLVAWTLYRLGT